MMMFRMSPWTTTKASDSTNYMAPFWRNSGCGCEDDDKQTQLSVTWQPTADIYETKEHYVLRLEIAGIPKDAVAVELKNNVLSISGEVKESHNPEKETVLRSERSYGKFYRAFKFPKDVDEQKIEATMKNGILEIKVAKPEEVKPKNISISIN